MDIPLTIWTLLLLSAATGLVSGVFLTFSDFVMKSLAASRPAAGTEAMQIINRKVFRSIFMVLLIGMIPISILTAIMGFFFYDGVLSALLVVAGLLYFSGVFLSSAFGNIPMNNALESLPLGGAEAQSYWPEYVRGWVLWNHVRWLAALGVSACYMISAVLMAQAA
ncbi:MAG: anthrone oxygenase family protein [Pseudomonadota bacterium]